MEIHQHCGVPTDRLLCYRAARIDFPLCLLCGKDDDIAGLAKPGSSQKFDPLTIGWFNVDTYVGAEFARLSVKVVHDISSDQSLGGRPGSTTAP
jgi:hypothetical protein